MTLAISREERQFIYGWFNAMLARELSDEQLNALQAGEFDDFFAYLSELGFAEQVAKFQAEVTACRQLEFPRLELAADFAQLFFIGRQSQCHSLRLRLFKRRSVSEKFGGNGQTAGRIWAAS